MSMTLRTGLSFVLVLSLLISMVSIFPVKASAEGTSALYADVPADSWYAEAVKMLTDEGIVKGSGNGRFSPERNVTRAEFVVMLVGMDIIPVTDTNASDKKVFKDIEGWYKAPIESALSKGIVTGYNDGTFKPNAPVTRAEAAVFVSRFMDITNKATDDKNDISFKDKAKIPTWAEAAVKKCVNAGIIKGYPDQTFKPEGNITRAEAASMLASFFKKDEPSSQVDLSFADKITSYVASSEKGNYLISPYSAKVAMAMVANGANGDTNKEIIDTLGISDLDKFNMDIKNQIKDYQSAKEAVTVDVNDSIWVNESKMGNYDFRPEFKGLVGDFYNGIAGKVNDTNAISTINNWISDKTNGKIKDCMKSNDFSSVLVNTLYFKAAWARSFEESLTSDGIFHQADGKDVQTKFMNQLETFNYYSGNGVKMIELPYDNNKYVKGNNSNKIEKTFKNINLSMYVILPDENKNVNAENIIKSAEMKKMNVNLIMPKFTFKYEKKLTDILKEMGIKQAFLSSADFSKMSDVPQSITDVLQSTYIGVDEEGTEAAAATVVMMKETAMPIEPIVFKADRPFQFVIFDNNTKETLFIGRYAMIS